MCSLLPGIRLVLFRAEGDMQILETHRSSLAGVVDEMKLRKNNALNLGKREPSESGWQRTILKYFRFVLLGPFYRLHHMNVCWI